jgi:hypothetical protein
MTNSISRDPVSPAAPETAPVSPSLQVSDGAGDRLVGVWRLVSCTGHWSDGRVTHPYGPDPAGLLVYSAEGLFSAQMHSRARSIFEGGNSLKGTPEEVRAAFESYVAYYGTYEVAEEAGRLTHNVDGSLFPNWGNDRQERLFRFEDERLVLTTPPFVGKRAQLTLTLVWERSG